MVLLPLILAAALAPQKVIFDCDIADDIDDAYALALLTRIPNIKILGVTTVFGDTAGRAKVAAKLLQQFDRTDVPIYAGRASAVPIRGQFSWAKDYVSKSIKTEPAIDFMKREIDRSPGQITIIAVGPLTNVSDLITKYPEAKSKIGKIVIMGGSFYVGYNNQAPSSGEWNIYCDTKAAQTVFDSGVSVTAAGLDVTTMMQCEEPMQAKLLDYQTKGSQAIRELQKLWGNGTPTLFDPVAVAYGTGFRFSSEEKAHLTVDDKGVTHITPGAPMTTILVKPQRKEFLDWYVAMFAPNNSRDYRQAIAKQQKN
jgi:inosine-uridine nucleoside N-ribohydrolase